MRIQFLLFPLLLMVSAGTQACGTLENWMDAYEGIESGNEWRDSMNQLETLVMMSGCGASNLDKQQQVRLSRILLQSLKQKGKLMSMPSTHYEIRDKLKQVRAPLAFDSLIKTIYRRFSCLSDTPEALLLREHLGTDLCPGEPSIAHVHKSALSKPEKLFECRTDVIEGLAASAFLAIHDSGKANLDWFDQKSTKLMSCRLSIVEGKYSARAHTNDITFEFEKDACESQSKNSEIALAVMNEGFLKISTRTTDGYISHLLMFYHAQPIACDIQYIDRKQLELLAIEYNPFK